MESVLLVHGVGLLGGLAGKKIKIPAGAMLGALAFVIVLNLAGGASGYPMELKRAVQVLSGIVIGSRFTRDDLRELRRMLIPAVILVVMLTGINVLFAWLISLGSELSVVTALFAAAPGGVTDLALIAADFGADTQQVALLQIFRFVIVVAFFPFFMRRILRKEKEQAGPEPPQSPLSEVAPAEQEAELSAVQKTRRALLSLAVAAAGASLAVWLGLPAGTIIGSIAATVAFNVATGFVWLPRFAKTTVQVCAGCYIGTQITLSMLDSLLGLLLPMALVVVEMFLMAFGTAWVIHKATRIDKPTALFSCIPGGISEMGIIAEEMDLDLPKVMLMHTCRVIAVICMMPVLLRFFTG